MATEQKHRNPFDLAQEELESMDKVMEEFDDDLFNGQGDFSKGDLIEATVIDYDERDVFVDLGSKQDGRCPRSDFDEPPARGSMIPVLVLREGEDGFVRLSRKEAERTISWENIREAFNEGTQLSGKIIKGVTHGYIVNSGGINLFLPMSQAGSKGKGGVSVGKNIDFKILELKDKHRSAVISHRKVVEEVNETLWNNLMSKYQVNDEVEGTVTKKVSFGVFIDVEGVEGLLHQSDISWKKYAPFKDRFKIGDNVHVKIINMDRDNNRLSLGLKQLSEDPWAWAERELNVGDIVRGKVTNITDYGAFLELLEGLEGLIHVSELTWSKRVKHPKKYLNMGDEIEAQVLAVDFNDRRIALGVKQLMQDPWDRLPEVVQIGDEMEGTVTSVTKFGAFVKVMDEVEGLIHFNDYTWEDKIDRKMLKKGDAVKFKILEINKDERRISCGIKQLTESPYEALRKKYNKGDAIDCKVTGITNFGLFVDIGDGFEGLVHISRIPMKADQKLEDLYKVGDGVRAVLLNIDPNEKKIALSIKAYEKKKDQDVIDQYLKKDDAPSTSSLGAFFKTTQETGDEE
jgi:small subunit ribosomal protein S1